MKVMAAQAALQYIDHELILGVGTGSTINCFIELLTTIKKKIKATVASSEVTKHLLLSRGFSVMELNSVDELTLYIDGADAYNNKKQLVKGGGGAGRAVP